MNTYTWNTLPTHVGFPGGRVCRTTHRFGVGGVVWTGIINISVRTNWGGSVKILTCTPPSAVTSGVRPAVEVTWNAVSGRTYPVQKTADLIGGAWTSVGLPFVARGALGARCDSFANTIRPGPRLPVGDHVQRLALRFGQLDLGADRAYSVRTA